jgi:hypothetical protein
VEHPEDLEKLMAFFPRWQKPSDTAAGWMPGVDIELQRSDGRKVTIRVEHDDDDGLVTYSAGTGDWPVEGDLKAFLITLQKRRSTTQPR